MKYLSQLGILLTCCVAGDAVSILLHHRLPGNVLGMALLFLLLLFGVLKESQVQDTADFLLHNMAFLFLPACLGVLEIFASIKPEIAAILSVCVLTTLCTAAATALTVHLVFKLQHHEEEEAFDHD